MGTQGRLLLAETSAAPLPQMQARDVEQLGQGHTGTLEGWGGELHLLGGRDESWELRHVEMNRTVCS